ncbi:hypothetical protein FIV42_00950 [Persicimonas caeni]|uniref:Uncharacterized protein n=1 Tax=Persicimonas caeni TaxID=2292766 RepID=A0A4Y6PM56_PERCE|nr:hypothetical protein [Persicimonas caeni]QDG49352.1 hypothetical protein FIV42_00950 [Persicimonas caeni]QED30573.1 hypothetical protein FRD00_00945 [Persicimonas caeni]
MNKTTKNKLANGKQLVAMAEVNGPAVAEDLERRQKGADGQRWTKTQFETLFVWIAGQMQAANDHLKKAALKYAAEQADDASNATMQESLVHRLRTVRNTAGEIVGVDKLRQFGLNNQPPHDQEGVIPYAENVVELLRANPDPVTNDVGLTFQSVPVADALEAKLVEYRDERTDANREKRQLQQAKADHDRAVDYWDDIYQGVASQLEGLFRQAGRHQLADRVRPTWAKSTGRERADEDPVIDAGDEPRVDSGESPQVDEPVEA